MANTPHPQQITALHIFWLTLSGISIYLGITYGHRILGGLLGAAIGGVCGAAVGYLAGWVVPMLFISLIIKRSHTEN